jgi:transcriptional regulator GlxA family with amidase domain
VVRGSGADRVLKRPARTELFPKLLVWEDETRPGRNFARLFAPTVGKTPGKHIEDLRFEAAHRQLEVRSASLDEVAKASGFGSAEVLRRVFHRRLGMTPGQYRRSFGIAR